MHIDKFKSQYSSELIITLLTRLNLLNKENLTELIYINNVHVNYYLVKNNIICNYNSDINIFLKNSTKFTKEHVC